MNISSHLRRRTNSGNWIPELDGLRFIAIAAVIHYHLEGQLIHHGAAAIAPRYNLLLRANGSRGVPLFFIISGFILARPFAQHYLFGNPRPSLRKYFTRRLTRLEPPYIVHLLAATVALMLIEHQSLRALLPGLAASLLYIHNFVYHTASHISPVAWSLEVEVQFYILAPLLTTVFLIGNAALRRGVLVAAMLLVAMLQPTHGWVVQTLFGQLQYFLCGLLFADLFLTLMRSWPHDWRWDIVSVLGWPAVFLPSSHYAGFWLPFLALVLYIAAFRGVLMYAFLRNTWVAVIGGMCYTIYLWHPVVMSAVDRVCNHVVFLHPSDFGLRYLVQGVVKVAAVAVVCFPLFVYLERPCMDPKWPQKLLYRLRGPHPMPAAEVKGTAE